jgi:hypothetical protein
MGFKLGDVSPLAGMMTGKGLTGDLIAQGFGGMLPASIARNAQKKTKAEQEEEERAAALRGQGAPMKKGGAVKKKAPAKKYAKGGSIDGCAIKGKTKGKMV